VTGTACRCNVPPQHLAIVPNMLLASPPRPRGLVFIGGFPAARTGDKTACGAMLTTGCPTVWIGGRP
jgi:uncharacterized Zn-binding protein involved in type VI secretion